MRTEGRVFIKPDMLDFIRIDSTKREEVLLKLGDPDAVALEDKIIIYQWTVTKGIAGVGGAGYSAAVTDITQKQFFLISFNPDNTVHKMEIIHHNIDKPKKTLKQYAIEWYSGTDEK